MTNIHPLATYKLITGFREKKVGNTKISVVDGVNIPFDHENPIKRIPEERLGGWRRNCGISHCGTGRERVIAQFFADNRDRDNLSTINYFLHPPEKLDEIVESHVGDPGLRVLVQGGHYLPHLRKFDNESAQPLKALEEALVIMGKLQSSGWVWSTDLLIFVNDLHMGNKFGAQNREDYFREFSLPRGMKKMIKKYLHRISFDVYFVAEKMLFNRLNREKKKLVEQGFLRKEVDREGKPAYVAEINGEQFNLIYHGNDRQKKVEARCVGACARLMKIPIEMGYTGFVQVYPVCGEINASRGFEIGQRLYGPIPNIVLYRTVTCFADKELKREL